MAGIYIHIPFCKKACHYCNFHFSTTLDHKDRMISAIQKEIDLRVELHKTPIETIYFGGGTPSILDPQQIEDLLNKIKDSFHVTMDAEITLEANPDDVTPEKALAWKTIGINRFSIGIQSFFEEDLIWMNRAHTSTQSRNCIEIIQSAGFTNFSIDLIYGTPGQSLERWKNNLEIAFEYNIPHLSCYALTVEEGTALEHMIKTKKKENTNTDIQSTHFKMLVEKSKQAGFIHYEISNFAKPSYESRHNKSYWAGTSFHGFGPAAHSYNGLKRTWNVSNNIAYIENIEGGTIPFEIEILSEEDKLNEYIMTSLRCATGINKHHITSHWGEEQLTRIEREIKHYIQLDRIIADENTFRLTDEGKFFADGIASSLFLLKK
jgi:oxygen-independent coproporphyrinogen-3 oxidase